MAYLKFRIKRLADNKREIRAYAYDSRIEGGVQKHFAVHNFGVCMDKRDAQERFNKWRITYDKAKTLQLASLPNPTLNEFSGEYLRRNAQLTGGTRQASHSLKHILHHLGHLHLNQLTKRAVLDYRDNRKKEPIKT